MHRCNGKNKNGEQCKMKIKSGLYCYHHKNQERKEQHAKTQGKTTRKKSIKKTSIPTKETKTKEAEIFTEDNSNERTYAEKMLEDKGYNVKIYNVDAYPEYSKLAVEKGGKEHGYPQFFINGKFIGYFSDILRYHE